MITRQWPPIYLVLALALCIDTVKAFQVHQMSSMQSQRRIQLPISSSAPLFARPNRRRQSRQDSSAVEDPSEVPANLRRKITAKRPALGHIVPKAVKVKGGSANPRLRPQGKAREAGLNNPSMLRIAGGTARGRRLDSPQVYLRPMMGKVREALYSSLTSFGLYEESSCRHLDIFAGSGSVGLESLSRGATHCTFVDLSDDCCAAIRRNVDWCQFEGKAHVVQGDYLQVLRTGLGIAEGSTFDIVTLCPPYEEVVYAELLDAVASSELIMDDTVVVVEYPIELGYLPQVVPSSKHKGRAMVGIRNRKYGRTMIAIYVNSPTGKLEATAQSRPDEFIMM